MRSALAATRAWNFRTGSAASLEPTSVARKSRTACRSAGTGRTIMGPNGRVLAVLKGIGHLYRGGVAQGEQHVVLLLADPAAQHRELDRGLGAGQVPFGLAAAEQRPAHRAVQLPPVLGRLVRRGAAARGVSRPSGRRAGRNPPTGRAEPNRHALVHSQPRSCRGSPRWVSSQSSTPRSPFSAIIRLPVRKSPWTTVSATGAGWCSRSQRSPISSAGRGSAKPWYNSVSWPSASTCGRPGSWSGSIWWIRASTSPRRCASRGRAAA